MKSKVIFVLKILVLVVLFLWVVIVFTDFFRVRKGKDPMFCLSNNVKDYTDGTTSTCIGLGYKVIKYERSCLYATQFSPIIISERQCN